MIRLFFPVNPRVEEKGRLIVSQIQTQVLNESHMNSKSEFKIKVKVNIKSQRLVSKVRTKSQNLSA